MNQKLVKKLLALGLFCVFSGVSVISNASEDSGTRRYVRRRSDRGRKATTGALLGGALGAGLGGAIGGGRGAAVGAATGIAAGAAVGASRGDEYYEEEYIEDEEPEYYYED